MSKKVFIVNSDPEYIKMFTSMGWTITHSLKAADIVQFTGGEDVSPHLYGETKHPTTSNSITRDQREKLIAQLALEKLLPLTGICRGAQFLNVICGGKLWQDVNNHAIKGTHNAWDTRTNRRFPVTSTHHQMMISSGKNAQFIVVAQESSKKERVGPSGNTIAVFDKKCIDPEAIWYPSFLCFCFQPHPEYSYSKGGRFISTFPELRDIYFGYLDEFLTSKYGT